MKDSDKIAMLTKINAKMFCDTLTKHLHDIEVQNVLGKCYLTYNQFIPKHAPQCIAHCSACKGSRLKCLLESIDENELKIVYNIVVNKKLYNYQFKVVEFVISEEDIENAKQQHNS